MAKSVSVNYYKNATAKCLNCGSVYTLGMTTENLTLEICGNCHPFYTGQEGTLIDTAGRIEKFKNRLAKASQNSSTQTKIKTKSRKLKPSILDLMEQENTVNQKKEE